MEWFPSSVEGEDRREKELQNEKEACDTSGKRTLGREQQMQRAVRLEKGLACSSNTKVTAAGAE